MNLVELNITDKGPISIKFLEKGIYNFEQAFLFVQHLSYKRNTDKNDLASLFAESCGTCSTKHALLKRLADETKIKDIQLMMGIFKMNATNMPAVRQTLAKAKLEYIPEAHNYLRYQGEIIDCTKTGWQASDFINDLIEEIEITTNQITDFKVFYHKNYLTKWLQENKNILYSLDELWAIRKQCIKDLYS